MSERYAFIKVCIKIEFPLEGETQIIATGVGKAAVFEFNHFIKHEKIHKRELQESVLLKTRCTWGGVV